MHNSETRVVPDMHTRKATMSELSDAFIALPGGYGTFEELFEVITWQQLGIHRKPIGVLNVNGFYDPFIQLIQTANREGFIKDQFLNIVVFDSDPKALLDKLSQHEPPKGLTSWLRQSQI
eukprot:TRINITY_DN6303_c0_g1_i1.p1 TRINITY_DN6303_c0_g1~~TRINITY_DN6303_c0_g1_i1.p1  ORF type:complete len:120 (+),score=26.06 TRINITY_DN6303_c0_g1_i1:80-439(+)